MQISSYIYIGSPKSYLPLGPYRNLFICHVGQPLRGGKKTLEAVVQRRARREPLPLLVLALGNTVKGLEDQAICYKSFFIEINPDKSLGMDSNCILIALFGLCFFL